MAACICVWRQPARSAEPAGWGCWCAAARRASSMVCTEVLVADAARVTARTSRVGSLRRSSRRTTMSACVIPTASAGTSARPSPAATNPLRGPVLVGLGDPCRCKSGASKRGAGHGAAAVKFAAKIDPRLRVHFAKRDAPPRREPMSTGEQEPERIGEQRHVDQTVLGVAGGRSVAFDDGNIDHSAPQQRQRVLAFAGSQRDPELGKCCPKSGERGRHKLGSGRGERRQAQRPEPTGVERRQLALRLRDALKDRGRVPGWSTVGSA
jgi:hypothetical protein